MWFAIAFTVWQGIVGWVMLGSGVRLLASREMSGEWLMLPNLSCFHPRQLIHLMD